ncbi:MAG: CpaF family protein [Actinomycetales bacterium]|nr:CpaF family protein [Actinomycetales bacterium]
MSSTRLLSDEFRGLIRARGLDPHRDIEAVHAAARETVQSHESRSMTGMVPVLDDPESLMNELVAELIGLGPLQALIDDRDIEEVWINAPDRVWIAKNGKHELTSVMLDTGLVHELGERMLAGTGRRLDISHPFVDAMLPGGHRLHVVLDGVARGFTAINIRKFGTRVSRLDDLVTFGSLTPAAAEFLRASVIAGLNIVVSGGTQAGKTTLLNCLASEIPGTQRLISVEETFELQCSHPDWVAMQTRQPGLEGTGGIELRDLVKETLRMRPSRIIVGEVRAEESLDLLIALNAGLPGMASIHANGGKQALVKLCTLPLLAGENVSSSFVVPTVAASVDLVVHATLDASGKRSVSEIIAPTGRSERGLIEAETVFVRQNGELGKGPGRPHRREAFDAAGIDLESLWVW